METYEYKATEQSTGMEFYGSSQAKNESELIKEIQEWYAMELGTFEREITVEIVDK